MSNSTKQQNIWYDIYDQYLQVSNLLVSCGWLMNGELTKFMLAVCFTDTRKISQ